MAVQEQGNADLPKFCEDASLKKVVPSIASARVAKTVNMAAKITIYNWQPEDCEHAEGEYCFCYWSLLELPQQRTQATV